MRDLNRVVGRFVGHILVGAIMFLVVAIVATVVGVALEYINGFTDDVFMVVLLRVTKYAILVADLVLLFATLGYATLHALKELRNDADKGNQDGDR